MTEGNALHLRPIRMCDAERVHEWASRPEACQFQPWGPNSRSETDAFVASAVSAWNDPELRRRVWVGEIGGVGVIGLGELKRVSRTSREIAYAVHHEHWGQGLATQIGQMLLSTAFADPSVERVQATCDPRNLASAAVLERLGMSLEGTLRHTIRLRDGWRDSRMYSILREEACPSPLNGPAQPTSQSAAARKP